MLNLSRNRESSYFNLDILSATLRQMNSPNDIPLTMSLPATPTFEAMQEKDMLLVRNHIPQKTVRML